MMDSFYHLLSVLLLSLRGISAQCPACTCPTPAFLSTTTPASVPCPGPPTTMPAAGPDCTVTERTAATTTAVSSTLQTSITTEAACGVQCHLDARCVGYEFRPSTPGQCLFTDDIQLMAGFTTPAIAGTKFFMLTACDAPSKIVEYCLMSFSFPDCGFSQTVGMKSEDGYCIDAMDMFNCQAKCLAASRCKACDWHEVYNQCFLHTAITSGTVVADTNFIHFTKKCTSTDPPQLMTDYADNPTTITMPAGWTVYPCNNVPGGTLELDPSPPLPFPPFIFAFLTPEQCKDKCVADATCVAFNSHLDSYLCYLHTAATGCTTMIAAPKTFHAKKTPCVPVNPDDPDGFLVSGAPACGC